VQVKCRSYVTFTTPTPGQTAAYTIGVPQSQLVPPGMTATTLLDAYPVWPAPYPARQAWSTAVGVAGSYPGVLALQLALDRWIVNTTAPLAATPLRDDNATVQLADYVATAALEVPRGQVAQAWTALAATDPQGAAAVADSFQAWLADERLLPLGPVLLSAPAPARQASEFYLFRGRTVYLLPLILAAGAIVSVFFFVASSLQEQEARITELLKVVGMPRSSSAGAWYCASVVQALVVSAVCTVVLHWTAFPHTAAPLLFVVLALFHTASLSFAWLVSTAFQAVRTGAVVTAIAAFAGFAPFFLAEATQSVALRVLCALMPSTAFSLAVDQLGRWETAGVGSQVVNVSVSAPGSAFSLAFCFIMLAATSAAYAVTAVVVLEGGIVRLCAWCPSPRQVCRASRQRTRADVSTSGGGDDVVVASPAVFQPATASELAAAAAGGAITISHLRKQFRTPGGLFTAVHDLSATLYRGEIFVLLGHNVSGIAPSVTLTLGTPPCGHT